MPDLLVTYMEMTAPPAAIVASPATDVTVDCERLSARDYLALYRAVGDAVQWDQRLRMTAVELERLLADPASHVHVLRRQGQAIGLCELFGIGDADIELVNFGLIPAAQGQGLGSFLLNHALRQSWLSSPRRIWLHTDTNDHPDAVPVYERAGFRPYLRRMESFAD